MTLLRRRAVPAVLAAGLFAANAGCLPDNAFRAVLSEQAVQTFSYAIGAITTFLFGLGDSILSGLVLNLLGTP